MPKLCKISAVYVSVVRASLLDSLCQAKSYAERVTTLVVAQTYVQAPVDSVHVAATTLTCCLCYHCCFQRHGDFHNSGCDDFDMVGAAATTTAANANANANATATANVTAAAAATTTTDVGAATAETDCRIRPSSFF